MHKNIFLFVGILVGFILLSFLGKRLTEGFSLSTNSTSNSSSDSDSDTEDNDNDNNNTTSSSSSSSSPNITDEEQSKLLTKTFYGPAGGIAKLIYKNGVYYIHVTDQTGQITNYTNNNKINNLSHTVFSGYYGGTARIIRKNGNLLIVIKYPTGERMYFTNNSQHSHNPNAVHNVIHIQSVDPTLSHGGQYPATSTNAVYIASSSDESTTNPNTTSNPSSTSSTTPTSTTTSSSTDPSTSTTSTSTSSTNNNTNPNNYNSFDGIPASMIPPGQEDLYILKSQVVTPVCPACPSVTCPSSGGGGGGGGNEKCPPCPACARCPNSNFECKKVPNYNTISNSFLPSPILNSFSTFGM